jgi:hypothetical protein
MNLVAKEARVWRCLTGGFVLAAVVFFFPLKEAGQAMVWLSQVISEMAVGLHKAWFYPSAWMLSSPVALFVSVAFFFCSVCLLFRCEKLGSLSWAPMAYVFGFLVMAGPIDDQRKPLADAELGPASAFSQWVKGQEVEPWLADLRRQMADTGKVSMVAHRPLCERRQALTLTPGSRFLLSINGVAAEKATCDSVNSMVWVPIPR